MLIDVYVEITNIVWENDDNGDVAWEHGTGRNFTMTKFESENLDSAIKQHIENETGQKLQSWYLYELSIVGER